MHRPPSDTPITAPAPGTRSRIQRGAKRAEYDRQVINAILDQSFLCHIGVVVNGEACVLPTAYVRRGDALYFHGHLHNRMLAALCDGQIACVTVTLLDGLVLARSAFSHSVNYRAAVLFGSGERVEGNEKQTAMDALIEHFVPGRLASLRPTSSQEWEATLVVKFTIAEASAKIRNGPPLDREADYALPIWAGVLPLATQVLSPVPCPKLAADVTEPSHITEFVSRSGIAIKELDRV